MLRGTIGARPHDLPQSRGDGSDQRSTIKRRERFKLGRVLPTKQERRHINQIAFSVLKQSSIGTHLQRDTLRTWNRWMKYRTGCSVKFKIQINNKQFFICIGVPRVGVTWRGTSTKELLIVYTKFKFHRGVCGLID